MKRKGVTGAEVIAMFDADPVYQARRREALARNAEIQSVARKEEGKVIADIQALALPYVSFMHLRATKLWEKEARRIVGEHLFRGYSLRTTDDLLRVIESGGPNAESWRVLRKFLDVRGLALMNEAAVIFGTLVYSLGRVATEEVLPELLPILGNTDYGIHRNSIIDGLDKLSLTPHGLSLLEEFQPDAEISKRFEKRVAALRKKFGKQR